MPVAEMPRETRKCGRIGCRDLDQRLRLADDAHDRSVIEHEAVAILQAHGLRQIEQETRALLAGQDNAAAMTLVGIENYGVNNICDVWG